MMERERGEGLRLPNGRVASCQLYQTPTHTDVHSPRPIVLCPPPFPVKLITCPTGRKVPHHQLLQLRDLKEGGQAGRGPVLSTAHDEAQRRQSGQRPELGSIQRRQGPAAMMSTRVGACVIVGRRWSLNSSLNPKPYSSVGSALSVPAAPGPSCDERRGGRTATSTHVAHFTRKTVQACLRQARRPSTAWALGAQWLRHGFTTHLSECSCCRWVIQGGRGRGLRPALWVPACEPRKDRKGVFRVRVQGG